MTFDYDESEWPLVSVRWSGMPTDAEVEQALAKIDAWLRRRTRFALLIEARGGGGLSPEQRVRVLDHMKAHADLTRRYLVQATVIDSLLQRTLFYGMSQIFPSPYPSKAFADSETARRWLRARLETPLPPREPRP